MQEQNKKLKTPSDFRLTTGESGIWAHLNSIWTRAQTSMIDTQKKQTTEPQESNKMKEWDPRAMLNNLTFLENKIHQLQDLVCVVIRDQNNNQDKISVQQQQLLMTADLTSIIVQLISTAGSLLPSVKQTICPENTNAFVQPNNAFVPDKVEDHSDLTGLFGPEQNHPVEEHEMKSEDDVDDGENLPPGSYEILQLEKEEILAPHTHFCTICGKGFKRDANLRMHMRGHGDEYKTAAALAKPLKESGSDPVLVKRYSCPFMGCKRNKDHRKFQPLKTILCVKNHYKRTHCDKKYTCSRCNVKKFSVLADLKTHEKHCGRDKWLCSCGTTFSRKDKLFGHVTLFQGHTPVIPVEEGKGSEGPSDHTTEQLEFNNGLGTSGCGNVMDLEGSGGVPMSYFSPLGFDAGGIDGGFNEFPRPSFEDAENSFSFLVSGSCDYPAKNGRYNSNGCSDDME